jgi:hypothetical protein
MSLIQKALLSVAGAVLTKKIMNVASELDVDDILRPIGLRRQKSHVGETLLVLGAGMALGGIAAVLLTPASNKAIRSKVSEVVDRLGFKDQKEAPNASNFEGSIGNNGSMDLRPPS